MERLTANLIGNVRRESVDGRAYLVAPVSMIVPGVLNGSKGALLYPQDEVEKNHGVWNNVPITIGHPYGKNNEAISARDPQTLEKFQIGAVYNDRFENGKRVADGWFDEALTKKKAPEVYAALNAGTPMEVSTGLFTDDEPAQNGANHGGVAYQFIAKNYRPDHLAVLPNQRGACSIQDGCGLNTNTFCPTGPGGGQDNSCGKGEGGGSSKELSQKEIDTMGPAHPEYKNVQKAGKLPEQVRAKNSTAAALAASKKSGWSGQALSLAQKADKAAKAGDHATAAKAHRAAADNLSKFPGASEERAAHLEAAKHQSFAARFHTNAAPNQPKSQNTGKFKAMNAGTGRGETHQAAQDGWHGGPKKTCDCPEGVACNCNVKTNSKNKKRGRTMTRDESVQWLVTNCDCHKGKERVLANADNYSDAEILALVENEQRAQTNQLVVNKFVEAVPGVQDVTINEIPAFVKGKMGSDESEEEVNPEAVAEEEEESEEAPVGNKKTITADQYLARMPASLRPVWDEMVSNSNAQRSELVSELTRIVKNERDPARRSIVENKLKGKMTNAELKELIALVRPTENKGRVAPTHAPAPTPNYFGMQGGPASTPTANAQTPAADLLLEIPTINFAELASPTYQKRK